MSILGPRLQSRAATLLTVAALHGLILWGISRARVPVVQEVETLVSVLSFIPETASPRVTAASTRAVEHAEAATTKARGVGANRIRTSLSARPVQPAESSAAAITLPAVPGNRIDWTAQLATSAQAELDKEAKARLQLRALTRRYEVDSDPRNPGLTAASSFRWYQAGIHRIDTRGSLPVLVLNDHCVMLMFVIPFCRIGHIESHGDLFEGAAAAHDERLATPGPNEVP
ncbi:MAG TPA: hypothetical protein VHW25_15495 [Steroidobacteraceae bacterium]|jgi:hypothetical protein|nr:hypothetical protein [Steroidobacteraceae bacterium]